MALITFIEIWRIIIMSLGIGFIFSYFVQRKKAPEDVLEQYKSRYMSRFNIDFENILFATAIAAPGVIFHELAHKFVAMGFGLSATFYAAYTFLAFAVVLVLVGFPFVFFVPGYVSISGVGNCLTQQCVSLHYGLIALAGPALNLAVFLVSWLIVRNSKKLKLSKNTLYAWMVSKKINLFLFIFNLLPIPGFDGWSVYSNLWHAFF